MTGVFLFIIRLYVGVVAEVNSMAVSWGSLVSVVLVSVYLSVPVQARTMAGEDRPRGLPDFSKDFYFTDVIHNTTDADLILAARLQNRGKPDRCRTDLCQASSVLMVWPVTSMGMRTHLRCKYAIDSAIYAHRDCVYDPVFNVTWTKEVLDHCPDPPLKVLLRKLEVEKEQLATATTEELVQWRRRAVVRVAEVIYTYTEAAIFYRDSRYVLRLLDDVVNEVNDNGSRLTKDEVEATLTILDELVIVKHRRPGRGFFAMIPSLCRMLEVPQGQTSVRVSSAHIELHARRLLPGGQRQRFEVEEKQETHRIKPTAIGVVEVSTDGDLSEGDTMYMAYVQRADLFDVVNTSGTGPEYTHMPKGAFIYTGLSSVNRSSTAADDVIPLDVSYEVPWTPPEILYDVQCVSLAVPSVQSSYIRTQELSTAWDNQTCRVAQLTLRTTVQCFCKSSGYVGLLVKGYYNYTGGIPSFGGEDNTEGTTLADFLGFPFNWELYIASHVLRAISLVCLVLTLVSYLIFKNIRRGVATRILLHLCIVLVVLHVTLYVTEAIAGSHTGCRASSVLRYYLVMTSLLWNAVEAFNMYLMLVLVFKSTITHLVSKAAVFAYGLPVVAIAIIFAIDVGNFDGVYDNGCVFRCQLRKKTLYFAFILPMLVIIAHNLILFVLVMRSLKWENKSAQNEKKSSWLRLAAAVSMLILLGIPWLFSAFGAIDASSSGGNSHLGMTEGVFEVIFIVFLNMQGVFIFVFHCARNADIRKSWTSTLSASSHHNSTGGGHSSHRDAQAHSKRTSTK